MRSENIWFSDFIVSSTISVVYGELRFLQQILRPKESAKFFICSNYVIIRPSAIHELCTRYKSARKCNVSPLIGAN